MDVRESLQQVAESVAEQPRRVIASALGVFWGAAAIVLMLAWGGGVGEFLREEFGRFGDPCLFVVPGVTSSGFPGHRPGVPVRVSREDARYAEHNNRETVRAVLAEHISEERLLVEARGRVRRLDMTASDERFPRFRKFALDHGRFFDASEVARARAVAVLGHEAAEELYGEAAAAIGQRLRVEGQVFEVIGVFALKPGRQYMNTNRPDNRLLVIPASAAEARLGLDKEAIPFLTVYTRAGVDSNAVFRSVAASLAERANFHPEDSDALRFFDIAQILGSMDLMKIGLTLFIGVAGTITLIVGAIGIANFHLATLQERAVELAVARAVGARARTLVAQTVLEAGLIASAAGLLGVGFGYAVTALAARAIPPDLFPAPEMSTSVAAVTLTALVVVTIVAALVPALHVRRLDVAIALREGV